MNAQKLPEVKWGSSYTSLGHKDKDLQFTHTSNFGIKKNIILSFNNTDEVVAEKKDAVVFGAATYLPPYGKVSGFDDKRLTERKNAVDWIGTTKPGLVGYSYEDVTCNSSNCPEVSYKTQFTFDKHQLAKKKTDNKLDIYEDKSRDNSPIYKLPDYPGLGVSFNLSGESTVKPKRLSQLVSSFSEDVTQQNGANSPYKDKNLVYTTDDYRNQGNHNHQDKHHAIIFYLNAKLHLLDKKQIKNIAQGKTFNLGTLKPRIDLTEAWKNRNGGFFNNGNWTFEDKGEVSVKLSLPQVKAGRCINKANPNPKAQALSPALTAPALWFGAGQDGKAQMYSASVSTYPDSSSSRIFLQNLERKTDPGRPGRYSLATLNKSDIESREPTFTGRQTVIRLDGGVRHIQLDRNNEVTSFNGDNGTFGIVKEGSVVPESNEWKKVLLPWTVRAFNNDGQFNTFNKEENNGKPKYSQKYRSRNNGKHERNLGDIVNSPIVAVGEYLATSANDGMVHIFKKGNGDARNYSLKLSYIPGTMPRKDIESKDSTLAKELRAFAEKGYVGDRYGVDGGFVLREVERGGKKHVFMFGAMGFGGRGAYALDLTKADDNDPTKASLFDVKDNGNNGNNGNNRVELGYTVGTPQIGKTHNDKYAAFLASGYATKDVNSNDN
ncbi:TPA: pilus assembly/adherence protein PilC, partial [Neisseria meningitidis]